MLLSIAILVASCQIDESFDLYNPAGLDSIEGLVTYTDLTAYPVAGTISTAAPVVALEGTYSFVLGEITAPEGSTFTNTKFSIDKSTGVVSYNNSDADLSLGSYIVNIGVTTISGVITLDDAVTIIVQEVPVTLSVDNPSVASGALDVGVIATVTYTDVSGEGLVTDVTYEFTTAVTGFTINATSGEISKTTDAIEGANNLSVTAITNVGVVTASDLVVVTVGAAPTIEYFQQDGTTPLTGVTLSPWSAYATVSPTLNGMDAAGGYELIVPAELEAHSDDLSVDANGAILIAADAELPEGTYAIGVTVTNGGAISKNFTSVFTVTVEIRWEEIVNDQLNETDGTDGETPQSFYANWAAYDNGSGSGWRRKINAQGQYGIRIFKPDYQATDASLTRVLSVSGYKILEVNYGELVNNSNSLMFWDSYDRALYYGSDNADISGGGFNPANWSDLIPTTDAEWTQTVVWNEPAYSYVREIDLTDYEDTDMYLHWRVTPSATSVASENSGQWWVDYLVVNGASIFNAEEE